MTRFPLRNYGPRVFISYSFKDKLVAEMIERALAGKGLQVRREDEASLVGKKLTDMIPQRIQEAEVLIQIRTAIANSSDWVAKEFSHAVKLKEEGHGIIILPVVFDKSTVPDRVKEWWFLDVEETGLTDSALDQIERICLTSVHLLRLSEDDPLSIRTEDMEALLQNVESASKRVIFDSDGKLLHWTQETLDHFKDSVSPYRDRIIAQETRRLDRLARRYKIIDEVIRKLAVEIMKVMRGYTAEPVQRGLTPLNSFSRMILCDDVVTAAEMAPPAPHPLKSTFKDRIKMALEANRGNASRGYHNPGLYAWIFDVKGGDGAMAQMGLDAPGFSGIPVDMPRAVFGNMADIYTRSSISFNPNGELLTGTFVDYVLPQIAIHAAYKLSNVATASDDIEKEYAWQLNQYRSMGLR